MRLYPFEWAAFEDRFLADCAAISREIARHGSYSQNWFMRSRGIDSGFLDPKINVFRTWMRNLPIIIYTEL